MAKRPAPEDDVEYPKRQKLAKDFEHHDERVEKVELYGVGGLCYVANQLVSIAV